MMGVFDEVEKFVIAHRGCRELSWETTPPAPKGYRLRIVCSCGEVLERLVTPDAAEHDLIYSRLMAFLN